jgi:hypothetical protein
MNRNLLKLLMGLLILNSSPVQAATVTLKIISAEWCTPCKALEKELQDSRKSSLEVQVFNRRYEIPILVVKTSGRINSTEDNKALGKLTDSYPEVQILVDWLPMSANGYSTLSSIQEFTQEYLEKNGVSLD